MVGWVIPDVSTSRGACGDRVDDCQKAGPGKYASSPTDGLKTIWGSMPFAHCARNSVSSSCCARAWSYHDLPSAMNAESQLH